MGKSPRAHSSSLPRSAYAEVALAKHADAAGQLVESNLGDEVFDRSHDRRWRLVIDSQYEDTGVATWPMRADVPEATIEGDEEASRG